MMQQFTASMAFNHDANLFLSSRLRAGCLRWHNALAVQRFQNLVSITAKIPRQLWEILIPFLVAVMTKVARFVFAENPTTKAHYFFARVFFRVAMQAKSARAVFFLFVA